MPLSWTDFQNSLLDKTLNNFWTERVYSVPKNVQFEVLLYFWHIFCLWNHCAAPAKKTSYGGCFLNNSSSGLFTVAAEAGGRCRPPTQKLSQLYTVNAVSEVGLSLVVQAESGLKCILEYWDWGCVCVYCSKGSFISKRLDQKSRLPKNATKAFSQFCSKRKYV